MRLYRLRVEISLLVCGVYALIVLYIPFTCRLRLYRLRVEANSTHVHVGVEEVIMFVLGHWGSSGCERSTRKRYKNTNSST